MDTASEKCNHSMIKFAKDATCNDKICVVMDNQSACYPSCMNIESLCAEKKVMPRLSGRIVQLDSRKN